MSHCMFKVGDGHFDFAWYDVYLGIVCNYTDVDYEMCSVLYNVGALHSILGSQETRFDISSSLRLSAMRDNRLW